MCLGVPAKLTTIEGNAGTARVGQVDSQVNLDLTPEARVGDFLLVHAGFAIKVMDQRAAAEALAIFESVANIEARLSELVEKIVSLAAGVDEVTLMEVCGTHTVAIARNGLKDRLPRNIRLISGPGCPVCVTPVGEIDLAVELATTTQARIVTFGDMLRVPGSVLSLEDARTRGAKVTVVYSLDQAINMARRGEEIVFLAVGFETTAPIVAAAVRTAAAENLDNFSVLVSHRLVPPALEALLDDPDCMLDGLLCPGHVSTVIGLEPYVDIARRYNVPCVVAGFEPTDILEGVAMALEQLKNRRIGVGNQYRRSVSQEGSRRSRAVIDEVFKVVDGQWRGLGEIEKSALAIRSPYARFDAARKYGLRPRSAPETPGCRCGHILSGRSTPDNCPLFGRSCSPDRPVGPCMVSSEGACSAAYLYGEADKEGALRLR